MSWLIDGWRKWCIGESASRARSSVGSCLLSRGRRCHHHVGILGTEHELVCCRLWFIAVLLPSNASMVALRLGKWQEVGTLASHGLVHKRLARASARPELAHGVCCVLFPHPPTSGTGSVLWWDGRISKVEFVCEGVGSMLMSVGSISCVSARQRNAGSPRHFLVGNKSMSPTSQRCCVCTVGGVSVKHTNNLRSCSPWRAFLVIVGMCALKDTQIRAKRELQWELNCFHVGLFSCLWPFGCCLIWNISSFLPFSFPAF